MRSSDRGPGGGRRGRKGATGSDEQPLGLGVILDELLKGRPWRPGVALGELARRWGEVVGPRLAEESAPVSLVDGCLSVRVGSAAWGAQLMFLTEEIRTRAETIVKGEVIRRVRVVVRESPSR